MEHHAELDLSELMAESLSLHAIANPQTRMAFSSAKDPIEGFFEQDPFEALGEKSFGEPRKIPREVVGTPVQEFFRDANVFVTGGTGFVGKLLTEKLVRSVPHIGHIYILIRPKRGKSVQERFEKLLEDQVFLRMKTEVPHYRELISPIEGDILKSGLGLSEVDRQLLSENVRVVFNSAADVRFVEPLRAAIQSNVYGSRRVMELAKGMKQLKSYVHVSTAFSQCVRRVIPEAIPKMSVGYVEILEEIESMTDEELERNLKRLLLGWPNTYTFSKAICEEMIQNEAKRLPVSIFRPSIVMPTYRDPVRGYTDNLYGPIGLMLGIITGVLHSFPMPQDLAVDMVPADYVINCMINVAYRTAETRDPNRPPLVVYNFTSPHHNNGMSCKYIVALTCKTWRQWPFSQAIWSTSIMMTESVLLDRIAHVFLHQIPGMVLDKLAVMFGQKPRLTMVYDRLQKLKGPLIAIAARVHEFETHNVFHLRDTLTEGDRKLFNFDARDVNVIEWCCASKLGLRYYYMKDRMETLKAAKLKNKRLVGSTHC